MEGVRLLRMSKAVSYRWGSVSLGRWAVGCGDCFFLQPTTVVRSVNGFLKYGHQSPTGEVPTGGLSQYCILVPGTPIFGVPESLSDFVACPANCATATVSASLRLISQTHTIEGSSALVVGAGMLGLTAAAQLSVAGASQILVADPDLKRFGTRSFVRSDRVY